MPSIQFAHEQSVAAMLDLIQLRTFVAVVQEGHVTRAAERLHMAQPTASNHIRALEAQFGIQLFNRTTRGLEPTEAGRRLAQEATQLIGASMELTSLARELRGSPAGRLLIGVVEEPNLLAQLPLLANWMRERHPLVELGFEARNSVSIKQAIATGEIDAGFFVGSALEDDMDGFAAMTLEFVVAAPYAWRDKLAGADWKCLADMPWIVTPPGTSHAQLAERLFGPHGLRINAIMVVTNELLIRTMVKGGVGVGFIRRQFADDGAAAGVFHIVPETLCTSGLQFGYSALRKSDPLVSLLVRGLHETGVPAPAL